MYLGGQAAAAPFVICSKIFTFLYFGYFILILPSLGYIEAWLLEKPEPSVEMLQPNVVAQNLVFCGLDFKFNTKTNIENSPTGNASVEHKQYYKMTEGFK